MPEVTTRLLVCDCIQFVSLAEELWIGESLLCLGTELKPKVGFAPQKNRLQSNLAVTWEFDFLWKMVVKELKNYFVEVPSKLTLMCN